MLVWLNLETKKKRESLAKFVMFVRMSQQQALEISGVAEGGLKVEVLYSENCSNYRRQNGNRTGFANRAVLVQSPYNRLAEMNNRSSYHIHPDGYDSCIIEQSTIFWTKVACCVTTAAFTTNKADPIFVKRSLHSRGGNGDSAGFATKADLLVPTGVGWRDLKT